MSGTSGKATLPEDDLQNFIGKAAVLFARARGGCRAPTIPVPATLSYPAPGPSQCPRRWASARSSTKSPATTRCLPSRIVTVAPDVTVSTNLGALGQPPRAVRPRKHGRYLQGGAHPFDLHTGSSRPKASIWNSASPRSNLFLVLSAFGLSHSINGERLLPIGTVYDPFIYRGADQLNYACYQDARFLLVATPSGVTLAPEGGAHQSIGTPLVGMAQDGLCAFEPAFLDELAVIMRFAFDYMQRNGEGDPDERTWLRDQTGGSVYLRLSTRPLEQQSRAMTPELAQNIVDGGYWMRKPGPNAELVIAYTGALAPEAIEAIGLMGEDRRDIGLLAITSADRLNAGWTAAQRARERGAKPRARISSVCWRVCHPAAH